MPETTPVQQLRDAAERLRTLADEATPGPLVAITDTGRKKGIAILGAVANRGTGQAIAVYAATNGHRHADARLAATLDNRVAIVLAGLLDDVATDMCTERRDGIESSTEAYAVEVAQLILEAR